MHSSSTIPSLSSKREATTKHARGSYGSNSEMEKAIVTDYHPGSSGHNGNVCKVGIRVCRDKRPKANVNTKIEHSLSHAHLCNCKITQLSSNEISPSTAYLNDDLEVGFETSISYRNSGDVSFMLEKTELDHFDAVANPLDNMNPCSSDLILDDLDVQFCLNPWKFNSGPSCNMSSFVIKHDVTTDAEVNVVDREQESESIVVCTDNIPRDGGLILYNSFAPLQMLIEHGNMDARASDVINIHTSKGCSWRQNIKDSCDVLWGVLDDDNDDRVYDMAYTKIYADAANVSSNWVNTQVFHKNVQLDSITRKSGVTKNKSLVPVNELLGWLEVGYSHTEKRGIKNDAWIEDEGNMGLDDFNAQECVDTEEGKINNKDMATICDEILSNFMEKRSSVISCMDMLAVDKEISDATSKSDTAILLNALVLPNDIDVSPVYSSMLKELVCNWQQVASSHRKNPRILTEKSLEGMDMISNLSFATDDVAPSSTDGRSSLHSSSGSLFKLNAHVNLVVTAALSYPPSTTNGCSFDVYRSTRNTATMKNAASRNLGLSLANTQEHINETSIGSEADTSFKEVRRKKIYMLNGKVLNTVLGKCNEQEMVDTVISENTYNVETALWDNVSSRHQEKIEAKNGSEEMVYGVDGPGKVYGSKPWVNTHYMEETPDLEDCDLSPSVDKMREGNVDIDTLQPCLSLSESPKKRGRKARRKVELTGFVRRSFRL